MQYRNNEADFSSQYKSSEECFEENDIKRIQKIGKAIVRCIESSPPVAILFFVLDLYEEDLSLPESLVEK